MCVKVEMLSLSGLSRANRLDDAFVPPSCKEIIGMFMPPNILFNFLLITDFEPIAF